MRKADYTLLAAVIREETDAAKVLHKNPDTRLQDEAHARFNVARRIAQKLSPRAHVKKIEFLKACGFES